MFSSLRLLSIAAFFAVVVPNTWGQPPATVAIPPQLSLDAKADQVPEVRVFALRNVAAEDMQATLRDLYGSEGDFVASAQPRTNQLVVVGTESGIERVENLLKVLDSQAAEPVIQMLPNEARSSIGKALAQTVAEAAQVDLAFDESLGVMMVRSESADQVKRFTEVYDQLNSQIRDQSKVEERDVLVRVSWLMPEEKSGSNPIAPDSSLKVAIDRLGSMGYTNLLVNGQLMTRCSISSSSPEFEAEGHSPEGFDFSVRGRFMTPSGAGDENTDVSMTVNVKQATKAESNNNCLLSVVLKMKEGKPIILGSAPVAGAQSFFVVQFLDAD